MHSTLYKCFPIVTWLCFCTMTPPALAHVQIEPFDRYANRVNAVFDDDGFSSKTFVVVKYAEDPSGAIASVQIQESSGNPMTDFNCLESLTENSPFQGYGTSSCSVRFKHAIFTKNLNQTSSKKEGLRKKYGQDGAFLVHLIPRALSYNLPSAFSFNELDRVDNIRKIVVKTGSPTPQFEQAKDSLLKLSSEWSKFLNEHPKASRKQILNQAKTIEAELALAKLE